VREREEARRRARATSRRPSTAWGLRRQRGWPPRGRIALAQLAEAAAIAGQDGAPARVRILNPGLLAPASGRRDHPVAGGLQAHSLARADIQGVGLVFVEHQGETVADLLERA